MALHRLCAHCRHRLRQYLFTAARSVMPDLYRVQPLLRDGNTRRSRSRQTTLSSAHRPSSTPITERLVAVRTFFVGIECRKVLVPQDGLPPLLWARPYQQAAVTAVT